MSIMNCKLRNTLYPFNIQEENHYYIIVGDEAEFNRESYFKII